MRQLILSTTLLFASGLLCPALARDPEPKPSGVVIHLFGQNSIMSNVLPTAPAAGASGTSASISPAGGNATTSPDASPAASNYEAPSVHDILHQMFIIGDPNHPPKSAAGRLADRPGQ